MQRKTSTPNNSQTHIAIILDCSGSMQACRDATIAGFNEQVQAIRKTARSNGSEQSTFVTLVVFNDSVECLKFAEPVDCLKEISESDYQPNSMTAMLDAVGFTLGRFAKEVKDSDQVSYLVVVISDGQENASKEHGYQSIAKMIGERQKTDRWTFSYLGANQDLADLSSRLCIPKDNIASFDSSAAGVQMSSRNLRHSLIGYLGDRAAGRVRKDGFFSNADRNESDSDGNNGKGSNGGGRNLN